MTFFYDLNKRLADLDRPQTQTLTENSKIKKGEVDEGPEVFKLKADAARKAGAKEFEGPDGKTYPVKEGNDGNLANNAKPYDKVTRGDVIAGRLGKDEMGGKAKKIKEQGMAEANIQPSSARSRSHIGNLSNPVTNSVVHPSSGKEIGIITKQPNGEYHAMPSSTALANSQGGTFATKDEAHQFIRNAHAKAMKNGTLSDRWLKKPPLPQFAKEQGVAEGSLEEVSLDLAKRARDKAEHMVDMDYDDMRDRPEGYSEKQRSKFQRYIDKKEPRAKGDRDWDPPKKGVAEGRKEDWDAMLAGVEKRRNNPKKGEVTHGYKHDITQGTTDPNYDGRIALRRKDAQGINIDPVVDPEGREKEKQTRAGAPKKNKAPERVTAKAYKHKHGRMEEGMEDEMPAGNYETGERGEYDREGDMAKEQLHTIEQAAQELKSILSDEENLPEWVQSKITKAMDYVDTARDYMLAQHDDKLNEKAVSVAQRRAAGIAHAAQKGEIPKSELRGASKEMAKMSKGELHKFAATKEKGLPKKAKKEESVDETTTAGSVAVSDAAPKGKKSMSFGKGIYDSVNREVEKLIAESMSINASMNMDQHGGPSRTLTVNATDDDAEKLAALLMMAGIGPQDGGCPSCGAASCGCDQQMDEAYGDTDATENQPDWPTAQEGSDDALQYSGGLNKPKVTGQTTVPVTSVQPAQSPLMYENSDLVRMLEMAGMDAAQLEPYRHTMKETDAEKSSVVKKEPGGFSATAPAGKRLSVTLGKQPLKPSDVKVKDKDMDENLVVTPASSAGSTAKPATPSAGSTTKPAPAPTKSGPTMGTIKGGVWTADPPKKGERGVPVPMPISEPVNETEPPEMAMGAGKPMPRTREIKPEPEMSMGATGKVDRSSVPMTVPPGVAGKAFDADQMASLSRIFKGAQDTPNYVGTQPEYQMGATGNPQRPMPPLKKALDLHTDPKVKALPTVRENSMENNLMRELANFKGKK